MSETSTSIGLFPGGGEHSKEAYLAYVLNGMGDSPHNTEEDRIRVLANAFIKNEEVAAEGTPMAEIRDLFELLITAGGDLPSELKAHVDRAKNEGVAAYLARTLLAKVTDAANLEAGVAAMEEEALRLLAILPTRERLQRLLKPAATPVPAAAPESPLEVRFTDFSLVKEPLEQAAARLFGPESDQHKKVDERNIRTILQDRRVSGIVTAISESTGTKPFDLETDIAAQVRPKPAPPAIAKVTEGQRRQFADDLSLDGIIGSAENFREIRALAERTVREFCAAHPNITQNGMADLLRNNPLAQNMDKSTIFDAKMDEVVAALAAAAPQAKPLEMAEAKGALASFKLFLKALNSSLKGRTDEGKFAGELGPMPKKKADQRAYELRNIELWTLDYFTNNPMTNSALAEVLEEDDVVEMMGATVENVNIEMKRDKIKRSEIIAAIKGGRSDGVEAAQAAHQAKYQVKEGDAEALEGALTKENFARQAENLDELTVLMGRAIGQFFAANKEINKANVGDLMENSPVITAIAEAAKASEDDVRAVIEVAAPAAPKEKPAAEVTEGNIMAFASALRRVVKEANTKVDANDLETALVPLTATIDLFDDFEDIAAVAQRVVSRYCETHEHLRMEDFARLLQASPIAEQIRTKFGDAALERMVEMAPLSRMVELVPAAPVATAPAAVATVAAPVAAAESDTASEYRTKERTLLDSDEYRALADSREETDQARAIGMLQELRSEGISLSIAPSPEFELDYARLCVDLDYRGSDAADDPDYAMVSYCNALCAKGVSKDTMAAILHDFSTMDIADTDIAAAVVDGLYFAGDNANRDRTDLEEYLVGVIAESLRDPKVRLTRAHSLESTGYIKEACADYGEVWRLLSGTGTPEETEARESYQRLYAKVKGNGES